VRNAIHGTRHTQHTHATYILASDIDFLAGFKVVECARACNRDALVHPVAFHETLRDLPLRSAANEGALLLRARQANNPNNNPPQLTTTTAVTLLLPFSPSAIARNTTSDKPRLALCITRRHTRRQHPTPCYIHAQKVKRPPPSLTCPCLPSQSSSGA
jgi:hypothetical protein